jgi:P27 family predicted phage terminase small subunit
MGRSKEPTDLKILRGNPGKRPIGENEVKPLPIIGECPIWLDMYAKEVWKEFSPKLDKLGLLTEADFLDFQNLCIQAGMLRRAYEDLEKKRTLVMETPSGYQQQRPEIGIINSCTKNITSLCSKFGMSPADRSGIVNPKATEKKSKMASLLSG